MRPCLAVFPALEEGLAHQQISGLKRGLAVATCFSNIRKTLESVRLGMLLGSAALDLGALGQITYPLCSDLFIFNVGGNSSIYLEDYHKNHMDSYMIGA